MNQKILLWIVSLLFFVGLPLDIKAQEETILQEIERTGLVKLGIRAGAFPFGYKDADNNFAGICVDLFKTVVDEIKKELKRDILAIKLYESNLINRFNLVENRIVHLECGPNTIDPQLPRNVQFSNSFFVTGTQLLIRIDNANKIKANRDFSNLTIGVLRGTITQQLLAQKYPLANLQQFQGITGRRRGIQAVQQLKIDAFASDGILLIGEATREGLFLGQDYLLVPQKPLDCVYYGFILPKNDPQWRDLVNSAIQAASLPQIFSKWFGEISPEIREMAEFCRSEGS
ncbi:amino acid ABC transporter substrate-binding protein [Hydrococcus rivularis NIES-593]|uniref:Amino acid ABC transporter substrate-binding protein n=1 Tax=Hydrococcus rivularis NIES-593 TaxID=1921803 RepID=A0A1U7HDJ2_9CYAN|nr:amino acid ABC transporter substrate-binding protein [Hydrococcus rivularis]OKH21608.1 amino acid ABC transporter substrate-binding protein [Hydrococcus rivularis NIES-593]